MSFEPKKILVTGAAGFIGCNFVRMILNKYDSIKIISYDKLTYAGSLDNLHDAMDNPRHVFIKGDICDRQLVANILREHAIDTIVHFAAESHVDNSIAGPEVFFQTNVMGTLSLIDEARKYWQDDMGWGEKQCRFHHVSTDEVYGTLGKDDPAFTEETPYAPNSPYSASKAGSDHVVRSYFHTYKLPVTMSNCSNNYGPYQHQEKLIPVIIQACIDQSPIPIYGEGSNIRDWLYVEDHCSAIDCIVRQGVIGETYNVGGDNELSNLELAQKICQQMDEVSPENKPHKKLIKFVEDRKGHDWRYAVNNQKICFELNWAPSDCNPRLLQLTIKHFVDNFSNKLSLVKITSKYYDFVRILRMDDRVKSGFLLPAKITCNDQIKYMSAHGNNYYICLLGQNPVGYIGVIDNDIRICVDPAFQAQGIGSFMLSMIKSIYPTATGRIKKDNLSSQRLFRKSDIPYEII